MKYLARRNGFPWIRPVHPRRRLTVRMDTTNICNLRCSMCPMRLSDGDPDRNWHHITDELFEMIRREVFPIARTVGISCGAEPLANPSFPQHLEALLKSGVPYREMVTNGTLLNDEWIRIILKYPPTTLTVSIDGSTPEVHGAIRDGARLQATVDRLKELIRLRGNHRFPMVGFSTTLQRDNLHQMADIVSLAAETGAEAAGFVPLVPYAGLDTLDRTVDMRRPETAARVTEASERAAELGLGFSMASGATLRKAPHPCPYLLDTVYIDPDGSIFPCAYWDTGNPIGNMTEGFERVWNGEGYRRLRAGLFRKGDNCLNCPEVTGGSEQVVKGKS